MPTLRDVERLRAHLTLAIDTPSTPTLDIEWLNLRCHDTLERYTGHLQRASLEDLVKDVESSDARFPGLIPESILEPFRDEA